MNPQETPQALDLSQDIASQGIQLSPEQQKSFQEYLDTLKTEEKQVIISLSQGELQDLKSILDNFDPRANGPQQTIANFIESQKSEGFSLTDLIPAENVFSEQIGNTEKLV